MCLRDRIHVYYETLVKASSSEQKFPIPPVPQRYFNDAYSFQYVNAIRRFVEDAQRVLVIGDGGGRDYYSMKLLGKQVIVMDIAPQSILTDMVIADANMPLPFKPGSFDAVVMAEVVEHLPQDYDALRRIRDIVRDDGCLVLTVPYYQDAEPTHVRIHSPTSIERLLRAAGWRIDSYIEKGGGLCSLAGWFPIRMALHGANYIAFKIRRKTFYQAVHRRIARFDFWLGSTRNSLHRWSRLYGAFIKCKKAKPVSYRDMNILAFENMHTGLVQYIEGKNRAPQRNP